MVEANEIEEVKGPATQEDLVKAYNNAKENAADAIAQLSEDHHNGISEVVFQDSLGKGVWNLYICLGNFMKISGNNKHDKTTAKQFLRNRSLTGLSEERLALFEHFRTFDLDQASKAQISYIKKAELVSVDFCLEKSRFSQPVLIALMCIKEYYKAKEAMNSQ